MSFHSKLIKPVTLIIQAIAEELAKNKLSPKMTAEQITNLLNLDDMSVSFSGKSTPVKKELPEWEGDIDELPGGIKKSRALGLLALAQAGVPDGSKVHTQKVELFKPNKQHKDFYTKGVFSGPQKDKDVIKWLCKQGEFGAPEEPEVVAELPMSHKWDGDKKNAAKLIKLVDAHKKKAEKEGKEFRYVSWETSRGRKADDDNFLYNDEFEICGSKEHKSEFLNLVAWLTENADFVEKARKETTPKSSDKTPEEKPKGRKAAPKKAVKEPVEDLSESSDDKTPEEKPKGRKAVKEPVEDLSESSDDKTPEEKPKGRKAASKVTKEPVEDLSESSEEEKPNESDKSDDPDADVDDKVADDEATIEMDDDDESSCDEVEPKFVMGYTADKVQKFNAKRTKLLETENDKYLNAKTGFEVSRNEKSELKFQWLEAYKVAVPNDLQSDMQAFIDMITKQ